MKRRTVRWTGILLLMLFVLGLVPTHLYGERAEAAVGEQAFVVNDEPDLRDGAPIVVWPPN